MIDKEDLFVGNQVYTVPHGYAVITKVGRKFTYTDNRNLIIENSRLMTKYTGIGVSTHYVFKSEQDYIKKYKQKVFVEKVEWALRDINLNLIEAKKINEMLLLGVVE